MDTLNPVTSVPKYLAYSRTNVHPSALLDLLSGLIYFTTWLYFMAVYLMAVYLMAVYLMVLLHG